MSRTLVIGDIHGGFKALIQILDRAKVTSQDQLIFLGDYVDGWSETPELLSYLIQLKEERDCIFIRGNHDDLVLDWFKTGNSNPKWLQHGGDSTMKAYETVNPTLKNLHQRFLENLTNYHIDSQNRLFLHAGFANMHGPASEFHANTVYWDRTLWEMALAMDTSLTPSDNTYPDRLKLFNEIYIGHTPTTRIGETKPMNLANLWNIDTGAAFKGPISLVDIESKQVWQSDPVHELYPQETGRN
ncbi:serine/threonine protein phosphatase [Psychroflexus gondwanensis]|jgi:serine/threonine protein phosphatase 1|uniref:metallophosphoesterase family protein n=1 Tax=Psychroflexus gondwanensis TaxID=251 RepID=UPI0011BE8F9F|nr:metallophosphoesterase family protein [Psychroflexus gondwanensis]TXE21253.1 serine/threonine protein phosphatase [Psychroflexus gondwanensis]